jgi:uncharacterized membrane protein
VSSKEDEMQRSHRSKVRPSRPSPSRGEGDLGIGFNDRLGATITRAVGSMWAFYAAALIMVAWTALASVPGTPLHRWDPYPFTFLLFIGNIVQLLLMFVILAGQRVPAAPAKERTSGEREAPTPALPLQAGGRLRSSRRSCAASSLRRLRAQLAALQRVEPADLG